ncbi:hypothetical protein HRI_000343000 [Hibiscus trionum]|uniref:Uncharacterized protein n=1 Tax=Hibiscus trionum TaxID=183268 RepID=A0A9W7LJK3_HIBTR|nr:hypothetical protein HRI_000343000 [Hibiscus trionum]
MWTTSLGACVPCLPAPTPIRTKYRPPSHFPINVSANSRLRLQAAAYDPKQEDGKEISGSDVLWALQRAAAQKKKAKVKKKGSTSSEASHREKESLDYSDVRPLEIKSEWSLKLDELEKRLQELEDEDTA